MDALSDWFIEFISYEDNPFGLILLALSAAIEYVFPPFPGDTITVVGAVLITAQNWNFFGVFAAVTGGSLLGALGAYYIGLRVGRKRQARDTGDAGDTEADKKLIDRLVARFERHGAVYLVLNRFLPGIRTFFFVAAGIAGMRPAVVAFYATLSAALWNLGLIGLGSLLGANLDTLISWVQTYTVVVSILIGIVVGFFALRWLLRRKRA